LNDEVDVTGDAPHVRPQADINLFGPGELVYACTGLPEHTPEFPAFGVSEIGNVHAVAKRLDDESTKAERSNAVLYDPVCRLVDTTARNTVAIREPTCKAVSRHPLRRLTHW
jgi:hypothetical protein